MENKVKKSLSTEIKLGKADKVNDRNFDPKFSINVIKSSTSKSYYLSLHNRNKYRSLVKISICILSLGLGLGTFAVEKAFATSFDSIIKSNISSNNMIMLSASISRTEFLASYPAGTVVCFTNRGVDHKVRIIDFNQSFQKVDFIYLDGGYKGMKDFIGYSDFVYSSRSC